jgi:murein L,D-transpeptidase YafK
MSHPFEGFGVLWQPENIFIRVLKKERILELWASSEANKPYMLVKDYRICGLSGSYGPKRKEGDKQVPEGFYHIDSLNPSSDYYLSLGINFPNKSDLILGDSQNPGGNIFIHGGLQAPGCIAVTEEAIKEIYLTAMDVRAEGQDNIPVHIFPCRMEDEYLSRLELVYKDIPALIEFWENLRQGYEYFEKKHRIPEFSVSEEGKYLFL